MTLPSRLDKGDNKAIFELWLQFQSSKGWTKSPLQIEALLLSWSHHGPEVFREALLASIANGWKNLYAPTPHGSTSSPRGSQKPEPGRHVLGISNPARGKIIRFKINKET